MSVPESRDALDTYVERLSARLRLAQDESERERLIAALGRARRSSAMPPLLSALRDSRSMAESAGAIAQLCGSLQGDDARATAEEALIDALRTTTSGGARRAVAAALGAIAGEAAVGPLQAAGAAGRDDEYADALGRIAARANRPELIEQILEPWRSGVESGDADALRRLAVFSRYLQPAQALRAISRIGRVLNGQEPASRKAAAEALGCIAARAVAEDARRAATKALLDGLARRDREVRLECARALIGCAGGVAAASDREALLRAALDGLAGKRLGGVERLREFAGRLAAAMRDRGEIPSWELMSRQLREIETTLHPSAAGQLRRKARAEWRKARTERWRKAVGDAWRPQPADFREAGVLESAGPEIAGPLLEHVERGEFYEIAGSVFREIGAQASAARASAMLSSRKAEVRRAALEILAAVHGDGAAGAIVPLLSDPDSGVRLSALRALARQGAREAAPALRPLLRDRNPAICEAAIRALSAAGEAAAADLLEAARRPEAAVRAAAIEALSAAGAASAGALCELLSAADTTVVVAALRALGSAGSPETLPAILPFILRDEPEARSAAVEAAQNLKWDPDPADRQWQRAAARYWADTRNWEKCAAVPQYGLECLSEALTAASKPSPDILRAMGGLRGDESAAAEILRFLAQWRFLAQLDRMQDERVRESMRREGLSPREESSPDGLNLGLDVTSALHAGIGALGRIGSSFAVFPLLDLAAQFRSETWASPYQCDALVNAIIGALGEIGSARANDELENLLLAKPAVYGQAVSDAFRKIEAEPQQPMARLLCKAFQRRWEGCFDPSGGPAAVDEALAIVLGAGSGLDDDPEFLRALAHAKSPGALSHLAELLGRPFRHAPVLSALIEAGEAAAPFVLDALPKLETDGQLRAAPLLPTLLENSADEGLAARVRAALADLTRSGQSTLRYAGARALARLLPRHPDPSLAPLLTGLFADRDENVRQAAADCCVTIGAAIVPHLAATLAAAGDLAREIALQALGAIGTPQARAAVVGFAARLRQPAEKRRPRAGSRRTFRVFVSSTFNDFKDERNALHRTVFPRLRRLCEQYGASFQALDLRWGISEDDALDQETMRICLEEIARCREVSPRPSFVCLVGDRYGWRPLPHTIAAADFAVLSGAMPPDAAALLAEWYERDDNAVPPAYSLKPRRGTRFEDHAVWERSVEAPLRQALTLAADRALLLPERLGPDELAHTRLFARPEEAAALEEAYSAGAGPGGPRRQTLYRLMKRCSPPVMKYFASATHQEIVHGALWSEETAANAYAFVRDIENLNELEQALLAGRPGGENGSPADFVDTVHGAGGCAPDAEARAAIQSLKSELRSRLGARVFSYSAKWAGDGLACDLERFCDAMFASLSGEILDEISLQTTHDAAERERREHESHARSRDAFFTGREAETGRILEYLDAPAGGILAVIGDSGSGKSALMAHAALLALERAGAAAVLIRFCGATPASTDLQSLLENLCRELARRNGAVDYYLPADIDALAEEFTRLLGESSDSGPLVIFLDALDQLRAPGGEFSLAWLPRSLPGNVRMVVSALPGNRNQFRFALEERVTEDHFLTLPGLPAESAGRLLDRWLAAAGRRLQPAQRALLLLRFAASGLPLYLEIVFQAARRWKSGHDINPGDLPEDTRELIYDTLCGLWKAEHHNPMLASRCLALLAAAHDGLSESELLDLLSRDREVYTSFLAGIHHVPPDLADCVARICHPGVRPQNVGLARIGATLDRLKADPAALGGFLEQVLGSENGPVLPIVLWSRLYFSLRFFVRERSTYGVTLFSFFHRMVREVVEERFLAGAGGAARHRFMAAYFGAQPWWISGEDGAPNLRKAAELVHHQIRGSAGQDLAASLSDLDYIHVKCSAGLAHELIAEYDIATRRQAELGLDGAALRPYAALISRRRHVLTVSPGQLKQEAAYHLPSEAARQKALAALRSAAGPRIEWENPETPEADLSAMPGGRVLAISPESEVITALGEQVFVWNSAAGDLVQLLQHRSPVRAAILLPRSRILVTAAEDGIVRLWNYRDGTYLYSLGAALPETVALAADRDEAVLAAGSAKGDVAAWDLPRNRLLRRLGSLPEAIRELSFDGDGGIVAVDRAANAAAYSLRAEMARAALAADIGPVQDAAIDSSAVLLASCLDGQARVWDLRSRIPLTAFPVDRFCSTAVRFAPDGRVAIACGTKVRLCRFPDGGVESEIESPESIESLAFAPCGRALGTGRRSAVLLDFRARTAVRLRIRCDGPISAAALTDEAAAFLLPDRVIFHHFARESDIQTRFCADPTCVALHGPMAAVGDRSGTIRLLRLDQTGGPAAEREIPGHEGAVNAVAFADGGRLLVSAAADLTVKVWDCAAGELAYAFDPYSEVLALRCDGYRAVGYGEEAAFVWDLQNLTQKDQLGLRFEAAAAVTRRGSPALAACQPDGRIDLWDLAGGRRLLALERHRAPVTALAPAGDGAAVSVDSLGGMALWNLNSAALTRGWPEGAAVERMAAAASYVAAFTAAGSLEVRRPDAAQSIWTARPPHAPDSLAIGSGLLAGGSAEGPAMTWNLATGKPGRPLHRFVFARPDTGETPVVDLDRCCPELLIVSDAGLALAARPEGVVAWDLATGERKHVCGGHKGLVTAFTVKTEDLFGKRVHLLLAGTDCGQVKSWILEHGFCMATEEMDKPEPITGFHERPDGQTRVHQTYEDIYLPGRRQHLLLTSYNLRLYGEDFEQPLQECDGKLKWAYSFYQVERKRLALSPDESVALVWGADAAYASPIGDLNDAWRMARGSRIASARFSPDSRLIALACSDGAVSLVDVKSRHTTAVLRARAPFTAVDFSADGTLVATGGEDGAIRVWRAGDGSAVACFYGLSPMVNCRFVPGAARIAALDEAGRFYLLNAILEARTRAAKA